MQNSFNFFLHLNSWLYFLPWNSHWEFHRFLFLTDYKWFKPKKLGTIIVFSLIYMQIEVFASDRFHLPQLVITLNFCVCMYWFFCVLFSWIINQLAKIQCGSIKMKMLRSQNVFITKVWLTSTKNQYDEKAQTLKNQHGMVILRL